MKTLIYDIETSPLEADVWGMWQQNVGLNQLRKPTRMLCFAAKWKGSKKTEFHSEWGNGTADMVGAAWELLNAADAVVHFNGTTFDDKHMNREFQEQKLGPPSPFKKIDVLRTVKSQFRLPSNKLQYVSTWLGLEGKVQHSGHSLWTGVMNRDPKALKMMRTYNIQDVVLLEKVYDELLPWIVGHPNQNLYDGQGCPKCGGEHLTKEGFAYTNQGKFQRFSCTQCGAWSKSTQRIDGTQIVGI